MNKKFSLFTYILYLNIVLINAQTNKPIGTRFNTNFQKSEFYIHLAKTYNSNALAILKAKTYNYYTKWADGISHYQILSSYGTVIHETCHAFNNDIGGFGTYGYFISTDIKVTVSKNRIFKSNEINNIIPVNIQSRIFRYQTYIRGNGQETELSSINNGIYGLLDEFDAYYQGTRAVVELYDYYKIYTHYTNPYYYSLYISNCYSIIYAYYEFRLFIAWYLKYAKNSYPEIYNSLMSNRNLKIVYTLIDKAYEKTVEQYFINRKIIINEINKKGSKKASIDGQYFKIKDKEKFVGYGIPDKEIEYLKSLYTEQDYRILKELTIITLNESNFHEFLD